MRRVLIIVATLLGIVAAGVAAVLMSVPGSAVAASSLPLTIIRVQAPGVAMETACSFVSYARDRGGRLSAVVAWTCQAPVEGLGFARPPRGLRGPAELHLSAGDAVWSFWCARVSVAAGIEDWTGCVHG